MNSGVRHPNNCGVSVDVAGVFICRMAVKPCSLLYSEDKKCELDKLDEFADKMAKSLWGDRN